jgi:anti-sigma factor RsiW
VLDCRDAREQLEEYRRGELPAEAAAVVEAHLGACPACRRLRAEMDTLAGLVRGLPRPASPARLRRAVARLGQPRSRVLGWLARPWVAATVAAVLVAAVLSPWLRFRDDRPRDVLEALLQSGISEHRRIALLVEDAGDVEDATPLFREVQRLTGIPLPAVFAGVGDLRLRDARAIVLVGRKTAAAALRYPKSPVTTYFLLRGPDLPMPSEGRVQIEQYRPYMRQIGDLNVVYWKQQDLAYVMVSGLDAEGCRKLFLKMRKAL